LTQEVTVLPVERAVLNVLAQGLTDLQIATVLKLRVGAVKYRLRRLSSKTDSQNRVALAVWWANTPGAWAGRRPPGRILTLSRPSTGPR
jgi:DNA-binding NarL/FixJ family response regulator